MLKAYRTRLAASKDGSATFGIAEVYDTSKHAYRLIGQTRFYRTHPASVRARSHAKLLCKRHCALVFGTTRKIDISEQ